MKFNITTYELWFWRIGVVFALFLAITCTIDNRKQDNLIFKTIDQSETTNNQITEILLNEQTNQEAIIFILGELNK